MESLWQEFLIAPLGKGYTCFLFLNKNQSKSCLFPTVWEKYSIKYVWKGKPCDITSGRRKLKNGLANTLL